jgi:DNA polymerase (family 10)
MDKHEIARILDEIGVLLSVQGENPFKIRAYHNAARAIENLDQDLTTLVREGLLEEIPGIGESIAEKVTILIRSGKLPYYEKLKKSMPASLLDLLKIPGLGAKKVKILFEKLKIKTLEELTDACKEGKIAKLRGFGVKTQEKILTGISRLKGYGKRIIWWRAEEIGMPILQKLSQLKEVKKAEIAGSFRRKLETIGDLDFLVASSNPTAVMNWFTKQPFVSAVLSKGPSKSSVRLKQEIQADIRVVPEEQFAFALMYFTGSKEHNIKLRTRTLKQGFSLSEYGFEPTGKKKSPFPKGMKKNISEKDVYEALGLSYIPPELREDMGEIEAAEKNKIPKLIEPSDIRGVFHCHTTESDGHNTLDEMVAAAQELGWEYIGISDHSKSSFQANGMDEERLFAQLEKISKLNKSKKYKTHIFAGLECDILNSGKLDFSNEVLKKLDFCVVSIHRSFSMDEKTMTARLIKAIENPYTTIVGHLTGRLLLRRESYALDIPKVIDAAIANKKIIEINAHPMRLEMDWRFWRKAAEKGLKCAINPDAHSTFELQYFRAGVNVARKGWLRKEDVVNTKSLKEMQTYLGR